MRTIIYLSVALLLLSSCNKRINDTIPDLRLQEVDNTIDLKLSDIGEDFRIIRLETDTTYLIKNIYDYLVGEKYIIVYSTSHLLQFSTDGNFIRCLASKGGGPDEFIAISSLFTNKEESYLFCHDFRDKGIRLYDLQTGDRTGFIDFNHQGMAENTVLINNKLAVIPFHQEGSEYLVYYQDTVSKFIKGLGQYRKGEWVQMSSSKYPFLIDDKMYCFNTAIFGDTIYCIDEEGISPFFYISGGPKADASEGTDGFAPSLINLTDKYAILRNTFIRTSGSDGSIMFDVTEAKYYFYDIRQDEISEIVGFTDDIIKPEGQDIRLSSLYHTLRFNNRGRMISIWWDAFDFIEKYSGSDYSEISPYLKTNPESVLSGLSENDNPVIMYGKLK